ncbi:hypothetical protein CBER1_09893 [Cercospora berteroae]|uniref:Uncharacterized protein n=1 Tax=Cercospora berteroae TaxID=357750 RepID=A0A2S6CJR4_9PEZI|nr:hypothetical protein CBER1_09893 [Cercospora berteroae]
MLTTEGAFRRARNFHYVEQLVPAFQQRDGACTELQSLQSRLRRIDFNFFAADCRSALSLRPSGVPSLFAGLSQVPLAMNKLWALPAAERMKLIKKREDPREAQPKPHPELLVMLPSFKYLKRIEGFGIDNLNAPGLIKHICFDEWFLACDPDFQHPLIRAMMYRPLGEKSGYWASVNKHFAMSRPDLPWHIEMSTHGSAHLFSAYGSNDCLDFPMSWPMTTSKLWRQREGVQTELDINLRESVVAKVALPQLDMNDVYGEALPTESTSKHQVSRFEKHFRERTPSQMSHTAATAYWGLDEKVLNEYHKLRPRPIFTPPANTDSHKRRQAQLELADSDRLSKKRQHVLLLPREYNVECQATPFSLAANHSREPSRDLAHGMAQDSDSGNQKLITFGPDDVPPTPGEAPQRTTVPFSWNENVESFIIPKLPLSTVSALTRFESLPTMAMVAHLSAPLYHWSCALRPPHGVNIQ